MQSLMKHRNIHVIMNRSQTSLGVQRSFVDRLEAAIAQFEVETGVRVSKTAFLEKLLNDSGYASESNRPRRDSNPGLVRSGVLSACDRHRAVVEAIYAPAVSS